MSQQVDKAVLEKLKEQRITTFKKVIEQMITTTDDAYIKTNAKQALSKNRFRIDFSKEEIHRILKEGTAVEKA